MALTPALQKFSTTSPVIQSFNYTDIASGTGMILYLGANTRQESTVTTILTRDTIYSNDIGITSPGITAAWHKTLDLDFDLTKFKLSQQIKGTAIITMSVKAYKNSNPMEWYMKARIRKWDGTTETEIAVAQTETNSANSNTTYHILTVKIPITTLQNFTVGETLRVTIEGWGNVTSGGSGNLTLYCDPINRTAGTAATTQLKTHIPYELQI